MSTELMKLFLISGSIHGILFVIFPLFLKRKIEKPIWYLNGVVFFISLNNLQAWLIEKGYTSSLYFLKNFEFPWYLLIVPLFHLFLIHHLGLEKKVKIKDFFRFLLIVLFFEICIRTLLIIICFTNNLDLAIINLYTKIEEIFNGLYSVVLFILSFFILFTKKETRKQAFYKNQKWLEHFMIFGAMVLSFWILAIILNFTVNIAESHYIYYPLRLSSSILLFWIGYQGMFHYSIIKDQISLRKEIEKTAFNQLQLSSNEEKLTTIQSEKFNELHNYILKKERFLNPFFSLTNLSDEYNLSSSYISNLINTYSGYNFSDYINQLRVAYAKQLLTNKEYLQYTIIAIGLESGFNSKSTFYAAFKKFTNKTPLQYRSQK
jgi:AraC-like DNA-binding protein